MVSYVGGSGVTGAGGSTAYLSRPGSVTAGDLLLITIGSRYRPSLPSGFASLQVVGATQSHFNEVFYKWATASEPSSYAVTSSAEFHAALTVYRSVKNATLAKNYTSNFSTARSYAGPSAGMAPADANAWIVTAFVGNTGSVSDYLAKPTEAGVVQRISRSGTYRYPTLVVDQPGPAPGVTSPALYAYSYKTDGSASTSTYHGTITVVLENGNDAPNAPTLTAPADGSTIDRNSTQRFDWDFSDPDAGDSQSAYNFRYRATGAATWTETAWVSTPNTYHDVAGGTFADATDYEWQVATKDAQGVEGPFSASRFFTAASPAAPATITYPTSGGTVNQADRVDWSAPTQESYQVRRVADNAGAADTATVYYDSGEVVSATARTHALDFATNDRYEHIQVRIKEGGLWSAWASIRVHVSYTPPPTPTVTPGADDSAGAVVLTYSTPAPAAGEPTVEYADIEVRDTSGRDRYRAGEGIRIGALLTPSGTFIDWLPAAGVNYEYRVIAVGDNGTTSASEWTAIGAEALASVYYGGSY